MERSCKLSKEGCEEAKKAIKKKGWKQQDLADFAKCSRQTVVNFYNRKPIDKGYFKEICEKLNLNQENVVELKIEETTTKNSMYAQQGNANKTDIKLIDDETGGVIKTLPKINESEANKNTQKQESKAAVIILSGKLIPGEQIELNGQKYNIEEVLEQLNKQQGFDLQTIDIQKGSIRIIVSDSPENVDRLNTLFQSGDLVEILGIPVEKVELLSNDIEESDIEEDEKLQLIEKIIAGKVSGDDLVGADLSNTFLYKVDLRKINLEKANLAGTDLSEANLGKANLGGANLERANLERAYLGGANLGGANLEQAYLKQAYLGGANLEQANLRGANLEQANLELPNLRGANLEQANLRGAYLPVANLRGADLPVANLRGAYLGGANLEEANLEGAYLQGAYLQGANLQGANLQGANLKGALVENALFSNSLGITPEMQHDLEGRGAIFGDKPKVKV